MCVLCVQSRVLSCSQAPSAASDGVLALDLCSLLSVLSQAESALQRRCEELQVSGAATLPAAGQRSQRADCICVCVCQGAELNRRRLGEDNTALQLRLKQLEDDNQQLQAHTQHTQQELTRTVDILSRYAHTPLPSEKPRPLLDGRQCSSLFRCVLCLFG